MLRESVQAAVAAHLSVLKSLVTNTRHRGRFFLCKFLENDSKSFAEMLYNANFVCRPW